MFSLGFLTSNACRNLGLAHLKALGIEGACIVPRKQIPLLTQCAFGALTFPHASQMTPEKSDEGFLLFAEASVMALFPEA
ncbi:hypothetical protein FOPE_00186 [Fonsecaea pedrosoi]|nr:hypothetical protein FOPE_00186 [Fonsecaea pedrosoi]